MKRQRGRNNGRKPHMPPRSQTFDSSGPDVRIRGNAYQVLEKYLAMARDATAAGDRIAAENFYQHAEHYYRVISANGEHGRHQHSHGLGHNPGHGQAQQQGHGQDQRGGQFHEPQHHNGPYGAGQQQAAQQNPPQPSASNGSASQGADRQPD